MGGVASILTVGEPLVCFAPGMDDPGVYRRFVGGAEVNTAVGLARLGHRVGLISAVGADPHGDFVRTSLEREGVSTALVARVPDRPTGVLVKERMPQQDPWVRYCRGGSASSVMTPARLPGDAVMEIDLVHLTGVFLATGDGPRSLGQALVQRAAEEAVPVAFDVNHRPALIDARAMRALVLELLPLVTHLLCNEREMQLVTGTTDIDRALVALAAAGPRVVIVKRGAEGASALIDGHRYDVAAEPVRGPVDTVGAGDAFNAGWLHGWLTGEPVGRSLHIAAVVSARVVADPTDHGGFPSASAVLDSTENRHSEQRT